MLASIVIVAAFLLQRQVLANNPQNAQTIFPSAFAVLDTVLPGTELNASAIWYPPGTDAESLLAKPFHIYNDAFYDIIGDNPTLSLIAETDGDPLFHEAVVWYPPTDEVFFVQNAGAKAAGTGLNKSAIVEKISLTDAATFADGSNTTSQINVVTVNQSTIINPNGGTNYKDGIVIVGEGQGSNVAPALYYLDPTTNNVSVLLNNYFGRQFNSLNDIAVNPRNKELYFTDTLYGYLQDFRPPPINPNQVYRFNPDTGLVSIAADGFNLVNGITFSPNGSYVYMTDTGINDGFWGFNYSSPATIYRYDVQSDGTFENRKTFAFVSSGVADGIHADTQGNVYAGCGDGVHVWNPSGVFLGKIYVGTTSANFQFAGDGRMVIAAETKLFYVTLKASGAPITDYNYSDILP